MSSILLVNGSPHKSGCTNKALEVLADTLKEEGMDSEVCWIGNRPIGGCICKRAASVPF